MNRSRLVEIIWPGGVRTVKPLILFSVITTLFGCHVPAKWQAWRYKSDGLQQVAYWNLPFKNPEAERFTIGNVYVHAFLKAHDETTQSGNTPYQLYVVCYSPRPPEGFVTFHDVEVVSLLDSTVYRVVPIKVDQRGERMKSDAFPYTEKFIKLSANASWASLVTDNTLALRPEKDEKLRIRILLEIASETGSEKKWITYQFIPHLEQGEVGYIGPGA